MKMKRRFGIKGNSGNILVEAAIYYPIIILFVAVLFVFAILKLASYMNECKAYMEVNGYTEETAGTVGTIGKPVVKESEIEVGPQSVPEFVMELFPKIREGSKMKFRSIHVENYKEMLYTAFSHSNIFDICCWYGS